MNSFIGIDEVGRGSWAGPLLVVAAQAHTVLPEGLTDSKLLSARQRETLMPEIADSCAVGEGWVQPEEIDTLGLTRAMQLGVARALLALGADYHTEIIMDGHINYCPHEFTNVQTIIGADKTHPVVSAASIYAKVKRDEHMKRLALIYPEYAFDKHVGYGTELHRIMLKNYGPSRIHRRSYKPVQAYLV
jgi:ribonuclease HII